jgi:hypothetical protein
MNGTIFLHASPSGDNGALFSGAFSFRGMAHSNVQLDVN